MANSDQYTEVCTERSSGEASVVASVLEAAGIPARILDENVASLYGRVAGIGSPFAARVIVPAHLAESAYAAIAAAREAGALAQPDEQSSAEADVGDEDDDRDA